MLGRNAESQRTVCFRNINAIRWLTCLKKEEIHGRDGKGQEFGRSAARGLAE